MLTPLPDERKEVWSSPRRCGHCTSWMNCLSLFRIQSYSRTFSSMASTWYVVNFSTQVISSEMKADGMVEIGNRALVVAFGPMAEHCGELSIQVLQSAMLVNVQMVLPNACLSLSISLADTEELWYPVHTMYCSELTALLVTGL